MTHVSATTGRGSVEYVVVQYMGGYSVCRRSNVRAPLVIATKRYCQNVVNCIRRGRGEGGGR